jgi:prevent-host-death family protein
MPEIGAYEAKTHLPKLLERIQKGERFTITKHGHPVAELIPVTRKDPEAVRQTISGIRSYRATVQEGSPLKVFSKRTKRSATWLISDIVTDAASTERAME